MHMGRIERPPAQLHGRLNWYQGGQTQRQQNAHTLKRGPESTPRWCACAGHGRRIARRIKPSNLPIRLGCIRSTRLHAQHMPDIREVLTLCIQIAAGQRMAVQPAGRQLQLELARAHQQLQFGQGLRRVRTMQQHG